MESGGQMGNMDPLGPSPNSYHDPLRTWPIGAPHALMKISPVPYFTGANAAPVIQNTDACALQLCSREVADGRLAGPAGLSLPVSSPVNLSAGKKGPFN